MITIIKEIIPNRIKRNIKILLRNAVDSIRYYLIEGKLFTGGPKFEKAKRLSVVFVCKGNVCRSAFAEQRFRNLLDAKNVTVDSCGIDVDQGNFPPADSVQVAGEYSCSLKDRRAKGLKQCDMAGADLILPVEYWQYKNLVALYPDKKDTIILLRTLAPLPYCLFCNIADPYSWGVNEFRRCYRLVDRCLAQLVRKVS